MTGLKYNTELLAPLQGLTALRTLDMPTPIKASEDLDGLCQLTGLRELSVVGKSGSAANGGLVLQLTELTQLTRLDYSGPFNGAPKEFISLSSKVSGQASSRLTTGVCRHQHLLLFASRAISKRLQGAGCTNGMLWPAYGHIV